MDLCATVMQHGGWGARIAVKVAPTPEADMAARAFLGRLASQIDDEWLDDKGASLESWPELEKLYFPICEHGMNDNLCYGPQHYCSDSEIAQGW